MHFRSLQIFRGLAALAVVLYHAQCYLVLFGGERGTAFRAFGVPFSLGAWFFFVLSGFLMARQVDAGSGRFLARRLARIYPSYWLAAAGVVVLKVVVFGGISAPGLARGLTLLPTGGLAPTDRYMLGIEWTLIYEVFFYAVCSAFANRWLRRWFGPFLAAWGAAIVVAGAPAEMLPTAGRIPLSPFNLLFAMGGLAYHAWRALAGRPGVVPAIGVVAAAVGAGCSAWAATPGLPLVAAAGAGFCGVILLGVAGDRARGAPAGRPGFLERLGDRSYGIYLVHVPVMTIILIEAHLVLGWRTTTALGCAATAAAIAAGWCFGSLDLAIRRRGMRLIAGAGRADGPGPRSCEGPGRARVDGPGALGPAIGHRRPPVGAGP